MIVDDIKKRITEAMKARRQVEREILRLAYSAQWMTFVAGFDFFRC